MNEQDERATRLGGHLIRADGDTLFMTARGNLTREDMNGLLDHFVRITKEHGVLFVFYDARQSTGIDSGARDLVSRERSNDAVADLRVAFGLPFTVRVVLSMILRARRYLSNREVTVHLFDKEEEAYAFFEKERARIRREKGIKTSL